VLTWQRVMRAMTACSDRGTARGVLQAAIMGLAWATAGRLEDCTTIRFPDDITFQPTGLVLINFPDSKTDAYRLGDAVSCNVQMIVQALRRHCMRLSRLGRARMFAFPTDVVAMQRLIEEELGPISRKDFRAGFITSALNNGMDPNEVCRVSRHISLRSLARYAADLPALTREAQHRVQGMGTQLEAA
jgi:hypothetical protein